MQHTRTREEDVLRTSFIIVWSSTSMQVFRWALPSPPYTRSPITTAYFDIFLATPTALAQMRPKASRRFLGFHGIDPNIVTITYAPYLRLPVVPLSSQPAHAYLQAAQTCLRHKQS